MANYKNYTSLIFVCLSDMGQSQFCLFLLFNTKAYFFSIIESPVGILFISLLSPRLNKIFMFHKIILDSKACSLFMAILYESLVDILYEYCTDSYHTFHENHICTNIDCMIRRFDVKKTKNICTNIDCMLLRFDDKNKKITFVLTLTV